MSNDSENRFVELQKKEVIESLSLAYSASLDSSLKYRDLAAKYEKLAQMEEKFQKEFKDNMKNSMVHYGIIEIESDKYKIRCSSAADKIEIDDSLLPEEYKVEVVSKKTDKDRIKSDLERGIQIPGVTKTPNFALRITEKE